MENLKRELIKDYKAIIKNNGLEDELYKWRLVEKLKGHPNLSVNNLEAEIRSIYTNDNNLVYRLAGATSKRMAELNTEAYRSCLNTLFDESLSLEFRVNHFITECKEIYKATKGKNSPHHDERTLAGYLTFKYPDKYVFIRVSIMKIIVSIWE